tara:strand:+ start:208 stop:423 length:216 start_codon:yes stop_codon:yes gene_type:complete
MAKYKFLLLIVFMLSHCSIDTKSGLWKNKNSIKNVKKISELNFNKDLSFDNFKKNVVLYGKKSNYPNLMEK